MILHDVKYQHNTDLSPLWCVSAAASRRVSFHARGLSSNLIAGGAPLIFPTVINNLGDAYNNSTGNFIAPYSGTYFFIATSGADKLSGDVGFYLYVDSTEINYVFANTVEGRESLSTVHGVVQLHVGQKVWLRSWGSRIFHKFSSFSGFLIPDS